MGIKKTIDDILEFKEGFVDKLNEAFGKYGIFVFDHPWTVIITMLLFSIIPAFGYLPQRATWIDGADNLYALPVSKARNEGIVHDNLFSDAISRASFVVITTEPPGDNLLTWDLLEEARQVDWIVRGKAVDPKTHELVALPANEMYYPEWFEANNILGRNASTPDKKILTYNDICSPDPVAGCKVQSIFEMGIDDMKMMLPEGSPPELWVLDGLVFASNRKGFEPKFTLGDPGIVNCTREMPTQLLSQIFTPDRYRPGSKTGYSTADIQCVVSAKAFHFIYEVWHKPEFLTRELAWETRFYDVLKANAVFGSLKLGANAFRSRDDELNKSTAESDDIIFVLYTFILLVSFTTAINFNIDQYRSKAVASLAGSVSCILGLYAGLGIPSLLWKVQFVPTALVVPFLVLGVGADDIFVIIASYALAYGEDSARDRCAVTLRGCGVSVVMTTITNVIAFAIGIQSPYLSIKNFCIFTLFGLLFSLIYEMTLFFAFVCLDAKKEENQRACLFCHKSRDEDTGAEASKLMPFDIHKAVSTFQVGSVLVMESIGTNKSFALVPHKRHKTGPWYKNIYEDFVSRGNYWFKPDVESGAHPSRQTSTTQSPGDDNDDHKSSIIDLSEGEFRDDELGDVEDDVKSVHSCTSIVSAKSNREKGNKKEKQFLLMSDASMLRLLPEKKTVNRFDLNAKLQHAVYRCEPHGNVGKHWRHLFARYYAAFLLKPIVKLIVLLVFTLNIGAIVFGFMRLNQGLEMKDLSPDDSYLKTYDALVTKYLSANDLPVEVFYPEKTPWHEKRVIETLRTFVQRVNDRPENSLLNDPLTRMYDDPGLAPTLQSGNASIFYPALKRALTDPNSAYKQFELDFVWQGDELISFRQQLLPTGTASSKERAHWMITFRNDIDWAAQVPDSSESMPLKVMFYNFMLVFYESDIQLMASVISSLSTASMAMLVVALMLIPDLASGMMVIGLMLLIDAAIIGYMAFWDVNLNMISMVILVISIGFAVDYSAHLCYAFVNGIGPSRNLRVTEAIVLVGTPLFHGALSNFIGIMLLGMSSSYILRIFFKMMTLVVLFGISHGMILLPVILSLIGPVSASVPVYEDEDEAQKMLAESHHQEGSINRRRDSGFDEMSMSVFPHSTVGHWQMRDSDTSKKGSILKARKTGTKVDFVLPSPQAKNQFPSPVVRESGYDFSGTTPLPKRR